MTRVILLLLVLLAGPALAQDGRPPTEWIIDPTTKCKIANAFPSAAESITWSGPCKDGYAEGEGVAQWLKAKKPTQKKYEGERRDGYPNGTGTYIWADGKRYAGQWVNGKQTGDGDFKFPNGDHYVG